MSREIRETISSIDIDELAQQLICWLNRSETSVNDGLDCRNLLEIARAFPAVELAQRLVFYLYRGDLRYDGETSVYMHFVETVENITQIFGLDDPNLITAAWLHDVVEDKKISEEKLRSLFPEEVVKLVMSVSKFRVGGSKRESIQTYIRKMINDGEIDIRVFLLKLADHLHNSLTFEGIGEQDKRAEKASESMRVYGLGLAEALGMWEVRNIICDNAFRVLSPDIFSETERLIENDPRLSGESICEMIDILNNVFKDQDCEVRIVIGGVWHVYEKAKKRRAAGISDIGDVVSYHLVFPDLENEIERIPFLYQMAGRLHALVKEIDTSRDNFYVGANRTDTGYEAIQRTLITRFGAVEVVFENQSMYQRNMWGAVYDFKNGLLPRKIVMLVDNNNSVWFLPPNATGIDFVCKYKPVLLSKKYVLKVDGEVAQPDQVLKNGQVIEVLVGDEDKQDLYSGETLGKVGFRTRQKLIEVNDLIDSQRKQEIGYRMIKEFLVGNQIGLIDLSDLPDSLLNNFLSCFGISYTLYDLYYDVGSKARSLADIKNALKDCVITKERLSYTSIEILGTNRPNLVAEVSRAISDFEGDIVRVTSKVFEDESFYIRFVIGKMHLDSQVKFSNRINSLPILADCQILIV